MIVLLFLQQRNESLRRGGFKERRIHPSEDGKSLFRFSCLLEARLSFSLPTICTEFKAGRSHS